MENAEGDRVMHWYTVLALDRFLIPQTRLFYRDTRIHFHLTNETTA